MPSIELQDRKGLSEKEVATLQELLEQKANALVGDVMVYELYVVAGTHIYTHQTQTNGSESASLTYCRVVVGGQRTS